MAAALKEELHRLVDEIPDTRPDVARVVFEHVLLLLPENPDEDDTFYRALREAADAYLREIANAPTGTDEPATLPVRIRDLRNRWVHGKHDVEYPLPRSLETAPDDDEPLTSEEIALLDARRAEVSSAPTIPHDELGRKLQA
jgi:hypothetical protein